MTDNEVLSALATQRYGETSQPKGWVIHVTDASGQDIDSVTVGREADQSLGSRTAIYRALADTYTLSADNIVSADLADDNRQFRVTALTRRR
ncbi:hypothetical protein GCM10022198_02170 [Klugiella xanthotipulae]|uniref:Uncharacterized protein n=1 Tax=Klugiella xanthotipulae TaxID=244735 RepID=A0A543I500_9MICO|nr:hypothetical protein [Klugiella xanthotipulae]TQM65647.1 hypothetical protein FB466_0454 [Klugiella xanthotipulae]